MVGLFGGGRKKQGGNAGPDITGPVLVRDGNEGLQSQQIEDEDTEVENILKFAEVSRSREKIVDVSKGLEGVTAEPYGEYLVIYDGTGVKIVDGRNEAIQEFEQLGRPRSESLVEAKVLSKQGGGKQVMLKNSYGKDPNALMQIMIDNVFPHSEQGASFTDSKGTILGDKKNVFIGFTNEGIILGDRKTSGTVYFDTRGNTRIGEILIPRNWRRDDPTSSFASVPDSTLVRARYLLRNPESIQLDLTDDYDCSTDKGGIKITQRTSSTYRNSIYEDSLPGIGNNVCQDRENPSLVYYCTSANPREIVVVDFSASPAKVDKILFPRDVQFGSLKNLELDPTNTCFCFETKGGVVFADKEDLRPTGKIKGSANPSFDAEGNLRVVNKEGYIVSYSSNIPEIRQLLDVRKKAELLGDIDESDLFGDANAEGAEEQLPDRPELAQIVGQYQTIFQGRAEKCKTLDELKTVRVGLEQIHSQLVSKQFSEADAKYVVTKVGEVVRLKERELATSSSANLVESVENRIAGGSLSTADINTLREDITSLQAMTPLLEQDVRDQIAKLDVDLRRQVSETFTKEGERVKGELNKLVEGVKAELDSFTEMNQFDNWVEDKAPQIRRRINFMLISCPLEAIDVRENISKASQKFEEMIEEYERKFKLEYSKVREVNAELLGQRVRTFQKVVDSYFERLARKKLSDRETAQRFIDNDETYKQLEDDVQVISSMEPGHGKIADRELKVRVANFLSEVERGGLTQISESGAQMVRFGDVSFPRWEAKVRQLGERKVDLNFKSNPASIGPGTKADEICGDICLDITDSHGRKSRVRLYEGTDRDEVWSTGSATILAGTRVPSPYITQGEYAALRSDWREWQRPDSKIKTDLNAKFESISQKFAERPQNEDGTSATGTPEHDQWLEQYRGLVNEYAQYRLDHHISILRRLDDVQSEPDKEYINGKGFVPEWKSHWVLDAETMESLEKMAKLLQMQSDTQRGMLNLIGHAGTGKDLLTLMFCNMTNRPYFGIECTKWTTEYELSEDVVLEAVGGASQTVKVPSAVLSAINTPGAVLYFNEFNAMPEQAQIFLHSLMDEKRTLTLKTSSGEIIHADPSVLMISSMNPNYPGTFAPQFATKSRLTQMEIGYPPLFRANNPDDTNPNPAYSFSEALRVARGVGSLEEMTYDPDMQHNQFVLLWDHYINGIGNGSPEPNPVQRFDMDVMLSLINFGEKLREGFRNTFEKKGSPRAGQLKVSQPLTGREMAECTYFLSQMPESEKVTADPEATAKKLLEQQFLVKIDAPDEREKLRQALAGWNSAKRIAA